MSQEKTAIEKLLTQKMGWEMPKVSDRHLRKAIAMRQKACQLNELSSYLKRLQTSPEELQNLVEQIVIRETWFFRHREAFSLLRHHVNTDWLPHNPYKKLRVLSIPCSTGEEPYSIAITLLDTPLKPQQFHIDGMDISQEALIKAKQGIYGNNSFRSHDWVEHDKFFYPVKDGSQICQEVRHQVTFTQKNLFSVWLPTLPSYQIIFCRHLLIYLDTNARNRALETLERLLCEGGLLFVGAVETTLIKSPSLRFVAHPSAFAYQKILNTPDIKQKILQTSEKPQIRFKSPLSQPIIAQKSKMDYKISTLETAQKLANQGQLEEATQECQRHLQRSPIDASAYLLLGEIYQAQGQIEQAQRYFQKAIYLKPNDREALLHLALLRESQGDIKGAAVLKNRIQRLENDGD
ncbi:CheR family methyltransferase [Aphanothece sacrum]|uniref:Chemotaxis protein CheR n=1 Tax=Aphanothece sacrum FPU1 TaxID=1920663 RepID=A0A401ICK5_APHSA|nr:CheR family methyltransferase [Aphanothece sacrum]GBF78974.1 chemotaxis protein CheR [Aphanothece sacrum FPU1]GBF86678.1 chemotaxis protein CheR [Aphanothece sacrum FPU3]